MKLHIFEVTTELKNTILENLREYKKIEVKHFTRKKAYVIPFHMLHVCVYE